MNMHSVLPTALMITIIGCSSTQTFVWNKGPQTDFISQLNKRAAGNEGEIITKGRSRIEARNIQIRSDTVFGEAFEAPEMYELPINKVQKIAVTQPKSRANGLLYGTLAGFAIGGAIGLISGDDPPGIISFGRWG